MSDGKKFDGDIYKMSTMDEAKVLEGTEVHYGNGITFRLAKLGNRRFKDYWAVISKPYQRALDKGTLDTETHEGLIIDALARTVVLGWSGIKVKGKAFPYTVKNAITLMTDLEEVREFVVEEAGKFTNFTEGDLEESAKN